MRVVLQVVKNASCTIDEKLFSSINEGFLLLVGYENDDNEEIMKKVIDKILSLRLFKDAEGKTNCSLEDVKGEIMCVSQFTLYADIRKGRRPSFLKAAEPHFASKLYDETIAYLKTKEFNIKTGVFGADMKISLLNDGPFTLMIDSKELF